MPDVDIDFHNRDGVLSLFKHTAATIVKEDTHEKHKTGIYFHDIPINPTNGNSSLDYKKAEQRLENFLNNTGTLIIASHSPTLLEQFCERGIVFSKGTIVYDGKLKDALNFYA